VQDLLRERGLVSSAIRRVRVAADKYTRAAPWAARAGEGNAPKVRGPWVEDFLDEACRFPHAKHDDQVDAVSLAVQMMDGRKRMAWGG
jgi:predicted phage terminase large subunit-like protein